MIKSIYGIFLIVIRETAAFGGVSLALRVCCLRRKPQPSVAVKKRKKNWGVLHDDFECELSFEIGQREGGFYSGRTDG